MTELRDLAEMLNAATGASRELDAEIANATGWRLVWNDVFDISVREWVDANGIYKAQENAQPNFTSSIDAALALVERLLPGWEWSVWRCGEVCGATVYNTPKDEIEPSISSHAPTAPLSILRALVAALIAQGDE